MIVAGDRAIDEARAADASLARVQALGPLDGVAFSVVMVLGGGLITVR